MLRYGVWVGWNRVSRHVRRVYQHGFPLNPCPLPKPSGTNCAEQNGGGSQHYASGQLPPLGKGTNRRRGSAGSSLRSESSTQPALNRRGRFCCGQASRSNTHSGGERLLFGEFVCASVTLRQVCKRLSARADFQHLRAGHTKDDCFKILTAHTKHLSGETPSSAASTLPNARSRSASKARARFRRELTVPKAQSSASAASA